MSTAPRIPRAPQLRRVAPPTLPLSGPYRVPTQTRFWHLPLLRWVVIVAGGGIGLLAVLGFRSLLERLA